jgi:hypothetical protein
MKIEVGKTYKFRIAVTEIDIPFYGGDGRLDGKVLHDGLLQAIYIETKLPSKDCLNIQKAVVLGIPSFTLVCKVTDVRFSNYTTTICGNGKFL